MEHQHKLNTTVTHLAGGTPLDKVNKKGKEHQHEGEEQKGKEHQHEGEEHPALHY